MKGDQIADKNLNSGDLALLSKCRLCVASDCFSILVMQCDTSTLQKVIFIRFLGKHERCKYL